MLGGRIGVSILDCDFSRLGDELLDMKRKNVTNVHVDIMDTSFVPNISFGPSIANEILSSGFVFDIHMMVASPLKILTKLDLDNVALVTIHQETSGKKEVFRYLREKNVMAGLAVNPTTEMKDVDLREVDFVLIMGVEPGFGGQKFKQECLNKTKDIKKHGKMIGVDGGINISNIEMLVGVDYAVVGSAYFRAENRAEFLDNMQEKFLSVSK